MIAAFVPSRMIAGFLPLQGLVFVSMYFVGIFVAIPTALLVRRTLLKGPRSTFVMELPPYKTPNPRSVFLRIVDRSRTFVRQAGTIIFAMSIIASGAHISRARAPRRTTRDAPALGLVRREPRFRSIEKKAGAYAQHRPMGRFPEPAVRLFGVGLKIGIASSLRARTSDLSIIHDPRR
jgi:ferrous iron transport protein B